MKKITALFVVLALFTCIVILPTATYTQEKPSGLEVYFSPHGGCTDAIVRELNQAKNTVLVQAYSFTFAPIAKALLNAHKRGVKVEVILNKSQRTQKYSEADFLVNSGIRTYIDAAHSIAHNKVMIIDGEVVITGSFNFTKAAEEDNAENLLVIRDNKLAELYRKNWNEHLRHSEVYLGKSVAIDSKPGWTIGRVTSESLMEKYYSAIWSRIKQNWSLPESQPKGMKNLETIIQVKIGRDGRLKDMRYEKRSGNTTYDQKAWEAIKKSEPFTPIPKEIKEDAVEIGIRFKPD